MGDIDALLESAEEAKQEAEVAHAHISAERGAKVDSVLRIISECIDKLKVSLVLPHVFENPITLRQYVGDSKYAHLVEAVENFLKKKQLSKRQGIPYHLNPDIIALVDLFHENAEILYALPNWVEDLGQDDRNLLDTFHMLHHIAEQRMRKSAIAELMREKKIHQIYHENEIMKKNIKEFQSKLRNQKVNLRWKLAAKDGIIQKYEEDLQFKKWDNQMRIKQEIVTSSKRIRQLHNASVVKQRELEEELERVKLNYEKVQTTNLQQEKEARDEKNKLLLQLQALLKKYDQTIGDKIHENMLLEEQYQQEKIEFDEFLIYYQNEEADYERIVKQKEEEEHKKQLERVMLFVMTRACKKIQRWWRKIKRAQKKAVKARGKGAKGKKR